MHELMYGKAPVIEQEIQVEPPAKTERKEKRSKIKVVSDLRYEFEEDLREVPKYYQTGIRPNAEKLKPIQIQAYKAFTKQLSITQIHKEFEGMLCNPLPVIIGSLKLTVHQIKQTGLMDLFKSQKFSVCLSG